MAKAKQGDKRLNNQYYQFRAKDGKPPIYTPETLWNKFIEYSEWVNANPLKEEKVFGTGFKTSVNKLRAMTIVAFCCFADMSRECFNNYKSQKDYSDIVTRIQDCIYSQKIEGAAADLLNPNIIARELGLSDKTDISLEDNRKVIQSLFPTDTELNEADKS